MTLKERFIAWVEKRDKKLQEQDAVSSLYHKNKRYHRFFEGYTEYPQLQASGRIKIIRTYTGAYYRTKTSDAMNVILRLIYLAFWVIAVICQVGATIADLGFNYTWYVTAPEAFGFAASFALMISVINALTADRKMKIRQYKAVHRNLPVIALIGSGIHLLTAICTVLYIIINHSEGIEGIWWPPVRFLIAAVLFFAVGMIEKHLSYEMIENTEKPVPGGIEIEN